MAGMTLTGATCWSGFAIGLRWVPTEPTSRAATAPRRYATPSCARPKRGERVRFPITEPGTGSLVWAHRRRVTDHQEGKGVVVMGKDVSDLIANALSNAAREAIQGVQSKSTSKKWNVPSRQVLG